MEDQYIMGLVWFLEAYAIVMTAMALIIALICKRLYKNMKKIESKYVVLYQQYGAVIMEHMRSIGETKH